MRKPTSRSKLDRMRSFNSLAAARVNVTTRICSNVNVPLSKSRATTCSIAKVLPVPAEAPKNEGQGWSFLSLNNQTSACCPRIGKSAVRAAKVSENIGSKSFAQSRDQNRDFLDHPTQNWVLNLIRCNGCLFAKHSVCPFCM